MKKIISVSMIVLLLFSFCFIMFNNGQSNDDLLKINKKYLDNSNLKNILKKTYFESATKAGFISTISYEPQIYQLYWGVKIIDKLADPDLINTLSNKSINLDFKNSQFSELEFLRMTTELTKRFKGIIKNKKEVVDILNSHFDSKSSLFFWKKKNEDYTSKITATNVCVNIINNLDIDYDKTSLIKNKLISLYNKDKYFTYENAVDGIVNNGGCIISCLFNLGLNNSDLHLVKNRKDWYVYWKNEIFNEIGSDIFSLIIVNSVLDLSKFFNDNLTIPNEYMEKISFKKELSLLEENNRISYPDLQKMYLLIKLFESQNSKLPDQDIKDYINEIMDLDFSRNGIYILSVDDNFYGIALAELCGFAYDKQKTYELINNWYTMNIEENSSIQNEEKLNEVYFLLRSLKDLHREDIYENNREDIKQSLYDFISRLKLVDNNLVKKNIESIGISLNICKILNINLDEKMKNNIWKFTQKIKGSKFLKTRVVCDYYFIIKGIEFYNTDKKSLEKRALEAIEKLKLKDGGYRINELSKESDYVSTEKCLSVIRSIRGLDAKDKVSLNRYWNIIKDSNEFKKIKNSPNLWAVFELVELLSYETQ